MSELPAGWSHCSLNDLGGLSGGKTPSKANPAFWSSPDVPWVSPKDMKRNLLEDAEDRISQIAVDEAGMTLYPAGSVLMVTRSGILQHTFPVALAGAELTVNQDIKVLRPIEGIDAKFAFYLLKSYGGKILSACAKDGTTVQSIDSEKLEAFAFPLPPLAEQTRIAAKLDELLAQVDTLKARIDGIPALLKRFRQSVLAAAVSGRLTEEWRASNPGNVDLVELLHRRKEALGKKAAEVVDAGATGCVDVPSGWLSCSFDALCEIRHGYAFSSELFADAGPIVLTPGNFTESGELDFESKRVVRLRGGCESKWVLRNGDVLVVMTDLSPKKLILGKAVRLSTDEVVLHNQRIGKVVQFSEQVSADFLRLALLSPATKQRIDETATGTVVQHTSPKKILEISILLPPLAEQTEIVRRVEQLFAFVDQLEARVKAAQARIDRLTQSILAKAFRGELVPQDPNDEPASVLLERIQAQRTSAPKARRGRKTA